MAMSSNRMGGRSSQRGTAPRKKKRKRPGLSAPRAPSKTDP